MKNYILAKPLLLIEQEEEKDPVRLKDLKNLLDMENNLNASDGKDEGDDGYLSLADSLELGAGVSKLANELGIKASSGEKEFIPEIEAAIKGEGETPPKPAAEDPPYKPVYDPQPPKWERIIEWVMKQLYMEDPNVFLSDFKSWKEKMDFVLDSDTFVDFLMEEGWFEEEDKRDPETTQIIDEIRNFAAYAIPFIAVSISTAQGALLGYRGFGRAAEKASKTTTKSMAKKIGERVKETVADVTMGIFVGEGSLAKAIRSPLAILNLANKLVNKGSWAAGLVMGLTARATEKGGEFLIKKYAPVLAAAIKQNRENKRLLKEAFEKLTDAEKIEKLLLEALDAGDYEKAIKFAKDMLDARVLPDDIRIKIIPPALEPIYKGAAESWTFVFKDIIGGMDKGVSIPQRVAYEASQEWKKVLKLADKVTGRKGKGKVPLPESIQEQSEDQVGVNALKTLAAKVSDMGGGEDKLKELMESEGMEDIARFFVEKGALEEYIKMLDAQDKELEKFISMMEGEIEKAKAEEKASAGQQTSPDAPATAEPQTQTPVNERKIKVSKSKLIDIISEQLKEQNEQIDIDHDELFALVAQEAFKQINRKK